MEFEFKPGMIVLEQGNPKVLLHRGIKIAVGSWWVHGFVVTGDDEGVEATLPRVAPLSIHQRLNVDLAKHNGDYIVMDDPTLTDEERLQIAAVTRGFIGRPYDIFGTLFFFVFRNWREIKSDKELFCFRTMAKAYEDGIGRRIFDEESLQRLPESQQKRRRELLRGYCTADQIFRYSNLTEVHRVKR